MSGVMPESSAVLWSRLECWEGGREGGREGGEGEGEGGRGGGGWKKMEEMSERGKGEKGV